jgi:hypothetical protein
MKVSTPLEPGETLPGQQCLVASLPLAKGVFSLSLLGNDYIGELDAWLSI